VYHIVWGPQTERMSELKKIREPHPEILTTGVITGSNI